VRALAGQPARRLFRAAAAAILVVALIGAQNQLARLAPDGYAPLVRVAVLATAALAGAFAIRNGLGAITQGLDRQATMTIRNLGTWTLYLLLGLAMASAAGLDLSGLLLGGAILAVIVATASQASLGNFFAGLVLMLGRPYRVGAAVRLRGPNLGTLEYEGTVVDMGALYTTLATAAGETLKLPNSAVVTSALVLGEAPLQAEIDLAVPPGTPLRRIEAALRDRLGPAASAVTIRPRVLEAGPDGKLACQVQVRSTTAVEPAVLAEALALAIEDPGGEGGDDGAGPTSWTAPRPPGSGGPGAA
jgi:small-conductance mechanosensitive channel